MKEKESVNHPKHYNSHPSGVESIDIIRHYCYETGRTENRGRNDRP